MLGSFLLLLPAAFTRPAASLPAVPREFRAAWVATVANIDWPSRQDLSSQKQRDELIRILDRAATLKMNAIVLQVRPAADALYASSFEPWSEFLTGKQGRAPKPYYDPLQFAVKEAHRRGLELHCWFNPYRARHPVSKSELASNHLFKTHPEIVKKYGKYLWMDPGEPLVQRRSVNVIADVVKRYDIDGVHIDDYFYPYPEDGSGDFPDKRSFAKYGKGMTKANWRRKNVDDFVENVSWRIHQLKPWVKFGISPFGVYRPGYPAGIKAGVDQYADLYADPLKWLKRGWCDYLAPQLYWPIAQKAQSYPVLLNYWVSENSRGRHIWPGIYTSRTVPGEETQMYAAKEVIDQVQITRATPGATGHIHFSMKALSTDAAGVATALAGAVYQEDALPPESPWLGRTPPPAPRASSRFRWSFPKSYSPGWVVMWLRYDDEWRIRVLPGTVRNAAIPLNLNIGNLREAWVAGCSRTGILGAATSILPGR